MTSVIFLNGTSSSGKTSIGQALQDILDRPYLLLGLDTIFQTVPARWAGGSLGVFRQQGFEYLDMPPEDNHPVLGIGYGPVGWRMMVGFHRAVAEIVRAGNAVIIDEMLLDEAVRDHWLNVLRPFDPLLVGVYCDLAELEQRERQRSAERHELQGPTKEPKGPRVSYKGMARWSARRVHAGLEYGVVVDTTHSDPVECAKTILNSTERGP